MRKSCKEDVLNWNFSALHQYFKKNKIKYSEDKLKEIMNKGKYVKFDSRGNPIREKK